MNNTVVGLQWGDEGKGKIIDVLASNADYVVRFQGGANAGHTVWANNKKYVFHLVPSGVLYPDVTCIIGNGTVLDIIELKEEIISLINLGVDVSNIKISPKAHIIMNYHKAIDAANEERKTEKIGTTKRGIGPCYSDKTNRIGIRIGDLNNFERFKALTEMTFNTAQHSMLALLSKPDFSVYYEAAEFLKSFICDTEEILHKAIVKGKQILFEGAQGIMLDIDHGTYPYVTSSNTHPANAAIGSGVPLWATGNIIGVCKAYTTRVGSGPFPTELDDENAAHLQRVGNEFGATTGRPRRCGWLDLPQLLYAIKITGIHEIALTKLDVLAGLKTIKVAIEYKNGYNWAESQPVYEELPGIPTVDFSKIKEFGNLPKEARDYIFFIEKKLNIPIKYTSTGPERNSIITSYET